MARIREENINTKKLWNDLYDGRCHNRNITSQFERFFQKGFLPQSEHITVLDVGCGEVVHFKDLCEKYQKVRWFGIDISSIVINKNKNTYPNFTFFEADLNTEEIPGTYDYVVSMHTFEHFENPVSVLEKCKKSAKKKVFICVPYEDAWGNDKTHIHKFTLLEPFEGFEKYEMLNDKEIVFIFDGEAK